MAVWNPEANDIFLKTIDIRSSQDRAVYLDDACHGDSQLCAQVESLLRASERVGSFLDSRVRRRAQGAGARRVYAYSRMHADGPALIGRWLPTAVAAIPTER